MDRIPRRDVADTAEPRHEAYGAQYAPVLYTIARGNRFGHPLGKAALVKLQLAG